MKPFIFSRSEVPESVKRFGLNSVSKAPKSRGFFVRPCYAEKNRATAVAGRGINSCWRQLEAKSFGVYARSDHGQLVVIRTMQPCGDG